MNATPYLRIHIQPGPRGEPPSAQRIAESIAAEIGRGLLQPGGRLPPVRVFAHQLGLSKNTVQAAYDELQARGLTESRDRQGVFIKIPHRLLKPWRPTFEPAMPNLKRGHVEGSDRPSAGSLKLSNVFIDPDLLPRKQLTACFRSVLQSPGMPSFYDPQGYEPLRAAIAARLEKRGMAVNAGEIIVTTGSQQALDIACRALRHKAIATENPAYAIGKTLFEMNGMKVTGLPLDPFDRLPLEAWERLLRRDRPSLLYLTTNFQNPTGYSYASSELLRIAALSQDLDIGIIEDDWGSDMLSYSEYRPPLRALAGPRVLYMNSFTKKLLPSLRIGYLAAHADLIPALVDAKRVATLGNPTIMEITLFEFLDRGYYDTHLRKLQTALDRRYHLCLALLERFMPAEVRWTQPGGGPLIWLELPAQLDLNRLRDRIAQRDAAINIGIKRFFGKPHLHGMPLGFAFLKPPELEKGIRLLAEEIRGLA